MLTACVLNYNGKEVLERCLLSIKAQTKQPDEIIVIDNASTDESWKISDKFGIRVVHADNEHKFITGLNVAFSLVKDICFFISNDVFLDSRCIEHLLEEESQIVWPRFFSENGKEFEKGKRSIMTAAFMMRKETFRMIGKFDTNLAPAYYEDLDYSIRSKKLGITLTQCKFAFCSHHASHSFSKSYHKKAISKICRKNLWYLIKKHGLIRVSHFLYNGKNG